MKMNIKIKNNILVSQILQQKNSFHFIRFIAASLIIVAHSSVLLKNNPEFDPVRGATLGFLASHDLSSFALTAFFFLSGFLITESYLRSKNILHYLIKRFLRIFPALIVVIFLTVFILGPIFTEFGLYDYFLSPFTRSYLLNITLLRMQFDLPGVFINNIYPRAINGSLWSLPVEFLCYLLLPLFFLKINRIDKSIGLGLILAFILFITGHFNTTGIVILSISIGQALPMIFYFVMGMFYNLNKDKIKLDIRLVIFSVLLMLFTKNTTSYDIVFKFAYPYVLMWLSSNNIQILNKFEKMGDFSYGIYIYAFPVQQTLIYLFGSEMHYIFFTLLTFVITFSFAVMSWFFVEKPAMNLKKLLK